jgi:PAS domain S-box-containing protein
MNKTTGILVVDDDPIILGVYSDLLRGEGYQVWEAATGQQGLQLTRERRPDLVVLDIVLPDMSGIEVCRQIKNDKTLTDTFVVLFSGEATSAAHKAIGLDSGADDYIVKPVSADELLARIRTIVRLRDTTVALRASEEHYRRLVQILPDAIGLIDPEGRVIEVNAQAVTMLGYDEVADLLGKSVFDLIPPDRHDRVRADLAAALETGVLREREAILIRKSSEHLPVELNVATLNDASGQPSGLVGVMRDITQRKQAEEALRASEERFRQLAESIKEVFWMTDCTKNEVIYISPGYEEIWGRTCESLYAFPRSWMEALHPEDRERVVEAALTKQISGQYEEVYRVVRPDGSIRWIEDRAFPIRDPSGQIYRIVGLAEDITNHKRAEDALRESEARKSAVMEAALDPIITIDHQGLIIEFNSAAEKTFGCNRLQAMGKEMAVVLIPASLREWFRRGTAQLFGLDTGPVLGSRIEMTALRADGAEFPAEFTITRVDLPGPPVFTAFIRDVSSRRLAESKLAMLAHAVESTNEMICITDLQDRFTFVNRAFQKAYGYADGEIIGKTPEILFSPRNPASLMKEILRQTHAGRWQGEVLDRRKDGTDFPIWLSTSQVTDTRGRILGLMGVAQDVTERKHAEEQIRLLADAVQSTKEIISITDSENRFIFVNQAFLSAYGYIEGEVLGRKPDFLYSPNNPPDLCGQIFQQTLCDGWHGELLNIRSDGTEFPISLSTSQIKNSAGGILGLVGVARNIAERKRSERQSTAFALLGYRLSAAVAPEQAANIILAIASDLFGWDSGYVHLCSQQQNRILPVLTMDTVKGIRMPIPATSFEHDLSPLIHLVLGQGAQLLNREAGIPVTPNLVPFGDRERLSASMMFVPIRSDGAALGLLSIQSYTPKAYTENDLGLLQTLADHCGDAFQRIKMAQALQEAEAKYRNIFENATEGIFQTTPEGRILSANPALARILGYESVEALVSSVRDVAREVYIASEKQEELRCLLETNDCVTAFEVENNRKDGGRIWISLNAHAVRDASGAVLRYEGTIQDITQRKQNELALRESEEKFRTLFEWAPIGTALHDANGRYMQTNYAYQQMLGYTGEELLQLGVKRVTFPDDIAEAQQFFAELRDGKRDHYRREKRYLAKDGHVVWAQSSSRAVRDGAGGLRYIISMVEDITARKRDEEQLRKLSRAVEQSPAAVIITDAQGNIEHVNSKFSEVSGYDIDEVRGKNPSLLKSGTMSVDEYRQVWQTITGGREWHGEFHNRRKNGELFWVGASISPILGAAGHITHFVAVEEDITDRKMTEQALRESEARLKLSAQAGNVGLWDWDLRSNKVIFSPEWKSQLGYEPQEISDDFSEWQSRVHPDDLKPTLEKVRGFVEKLWPNYEVDFRMRHKDGSYRWILARASLLCGIRGTPERMLGSHVDITERKQAEQELRRLTRRIIDAQEIERQRVARDLHDGVNQLIASAKMRLRKVIETLPSLSPASREILGRCDQLMVQALEENRRIAHNLRPSDLDELGLAAACRSFCKEVQTRTNLSIQCRISRIEQRWSREVELNLFRIVQEAVNNIEKHARARMVHLQIGLQGEAIVLKIKDDGQGFSTAAADSDKRKGHGIGLTNMRERAVSLGGTCQVKSTLKQGTTISVRVPLKEAKG